MRGGLHMCKTHTAATTVKMQLLYMLDLNLLVCQSPNLIVYGHGGRSFLKAALRNV